MLFLKAVFFQPCFQFQESLVPPLRTWKYHLKICLLGLILLCESSLSRVWFAYDLPYKGVRFQWTVPLLWINGIFTISLLSYLLTKICQVLFLSNIFQTSRKVAAGENGVNSLSICCSANWKIWRQKFRTSSTRNFPTTDFSNIVDNAKSL